MNQLDFETFKTVLGEDFGKLKGKFDEANFERVLEEREFEDDVVKQEVLKNELMEDGFFRGHELSKENDIKLVDNTPMYVRIICTGIVITVATLMSARYSSDVKQLIAFLSITNSCINYIIIPLWEKHLISAVVIIAVATTYAFTVLFLFCNDWWALEYWPIYCIIIEIVFDYLLDRNWAIYRRFRKIIKNKIEHGRSYSLSMLESHNVADQVLDNSDPYSYWSLYAGITFIMGFYEYIIWFMGTIIISVIFKYASGNKWNNCT